MQGTIPKISDFGLSVEKKDGKKIKAGTPGYMAPEIIDCEEVLGIKWENFEMDKRSDLFSLSILLFVLFHKGKWPYPSELDSVEKLNEAVLKKNLRPKFNEFFFSKDLKNKIEEMWSKKPEKRPTLNKILRVFSKLKNSQKIQDFDEQKKLLKEKEKNEIEAKKLFEEAEDLFFHGNYSKAFEFKM